jgi:hypothetical protein
LAVEEEVLDVEEEDVLDICEPVSPDGTRDAGGL